MKALLRSPSFCAQTFTKDNQCPIRTIPRPCIETNPMLTCYYPKMSDDLTTKGECDMKFMKPCGKQEPIVNNYNKPVRKLNFWSNLPR